jgi:hypothetical protein
VIASAAPSSPLMAYPTPPRLPGARNRISSPRGLPGRLLAWVRANDNEDDYDDEAAFAGRKGAGSVQLIEQLKNVI